MTLHLQLLYSTNQQVTIIISHTCHLNDIMTADKWVSEQILNATSAQLGYIIQWHSCRYTLDNTWQNTISRTDIAKPKDSHKHIHKLFTRAQTITVNSQQHTENLTFLIWPSDHRWTRHVRPCNTDTSKRQTQSTINLTQAVSRYKQAIHNPPVDDEISLHTRSQAVARIADRTSSQHFWGSRHVIGHTSRDHLTPHMPFPIGCPLD